MFAMKVLRKENVMNRNQVEHTMWAKMMTNRFSPNSIVPFFIRFLFSNNSGKNSGNFRCSMMDVDVST